MRPESYRLSDVFHWMRILPKTILKGQEAVVHELPITENILEIALRHADQAGAACVTDIYLVIGQLASVVDEFVTFYWDIISAGTIAEGSPAALRPSSGRTPLPRLYQHLPPCGR